MMTKLIIAVLLCALVSVHFMLDRRAKRNEEERESERRREIFALSKSHCVRYELAHRVKQVANLGRIDASYMIETTTTMMRVNKEK